ncbi:MAG: lysyl oxidase family protein [Saprospiraceae bacterium]
MFLTLTNTKINISNYVKAILFFALVFSTNLCYAQPDLALDGARIRSTMSLDQLTLADNNNNNCYINEGCISGTGDRLLLRFTTKILNIGNEDFYVGPPPSDPSLENETWEWDECHRHWHYEGYARYLLYDENGQQTDVGFKNGFCLIDIQCTSGSFTYTCSNQGISAGCADIYSRNLDCQWIDLTPIPSGRYQLVVEVNWDRSPDANGRVEQQFSNNSSSVCFDLVNESGSVPNITVIDDVDCENTGCTDSDNDGVCNEEDCQPNNPNRPTTPGLTCDDNDPNTINDVIQSDGCTCSGDPSNGGGDCGDLAAIGGDGTLSVSGFADFANHNVQVFTST